MTPKTGPLVSVVIPVFNAEKWLFSLLTSIKAQTYKNLELIVIDDGSTDGSLDIAQRYAVQNPEIIMRVMSQENRGVSDARNLGIMNCSGEYIAFVDSDDLWFSNKIEKQVTAVTKSGSGVIACSYVIFSDSNSKILETVKPNWSTKGVRNWLLFRSYGGLLSSTLLINKDVLQKVNGFKSNLSLSADIEFAWRLIKISNVECISEPLVAYRLRPNQMHKLPILLISEAARMIQVVDILKIDMYRKIFLANLYLRLSLYSIKDRHLIEGLGHLSTAVRTNVLEINITMLRIIIHRGSRSVKKLHGRNLRLPLP
jgi:glycosyltransferase involved in cell wall biosynthesis